MLSTQIEFITNSVSTGFKFCSLKVKGSENVYSSYHSSDLKPAVRLFVMKLGSAAHATGLRDR